MLRARHTATPAPTQRRASLVGRFQGQRLKKGPGAVSSPSPRPRRSSRMRPCSNAPQRSGTNNTLCCKGADGWARMHLPATRPPNNSSSPSMWAHRHSCGRSASAAIKMAAYHSIRSLVNRLRGRLPDNRNDGNHGASHAHRHCRYCGKKHPDSPNNSSRSMRHRIPDIVRISFAQAPPLTTTPWSSKQRPWGCAERRSRTHILPPPRSFPLPQQDTQALCQSLQAGPRAGSAWETAR